jgi:cytosine/adenosine deaminase-related metal-dependent hydrolase
VSPDRKRSPRSEVPPRDDRLLLENCLCVLPDPSDPTSPTLEGVDILIEGGRIVRVGRGAGTGARAPGDARARVIDASSCVVVPGFVNTHHHFYQVLTRAVPAVQDAKLFRWLQYLYEVWQHIDPEAVRVSSTVAMGELLKTGCTCTTDHHYLYPRGFDADLTALQFEAADAVGMRFAPMRGSMSLSKKDGGLPPDSVVQTQDEILKDSQRVIETFHDPRPAAMRKVGLAPCSPFSVTRDLMVETARLARAYGVRLHTHLAETEDEDAYCQRTYGRRPLELMEEWGFVGEDVSYAHGIWFDDRELETLAGTGTAVCHCPSSNMRLGSGIARVKEMLDGGITVSLAVDGSASNDASDFLGEMRQALFLQRVRYGADALSVRRVFTMATTMGARVLGFSGDGGIGRIAEGWAADLALFDVKRLEYAGALGDPLAALLLAGSDHRTRFTIVNGQVVVEAGELKGVDETTLTEQANRIAERLQRTAGR